MSSRSSAQTRRSIESCSLAPASFPQVAPFQTFDRRRALSIAARMDDVGPLRPGDERARTDRRTAYYGNALALAATSSPVKAGRSGLETLRTNVPHPYPRDGRRGHTKGLAAPPRTSVANREGAELIGSSNDVQPHLVVDSGSPLPTSSISGRSKTGSVRIYTKWWHSPSNIGGTSAALVGFRRSASDGRDAILVGDIRIDSMDWEASEHIFPNEAAERLGKEFDAWLSASYVEA